MSVALAGLAHSRLNLPQQAAPVQLSDTARRKLEPLVARAAGQPLLPSEAAALLVDALPKDFRAACGEMVENWGAEARGTTQWTAQVLYVARHAGRSTAVVVYRCGSSVPEYAEFYDERPAALAFGSNAASLRLIPLAADCQNCSELYHVSFAQAFAVEGADLIQLYVSSSTDNPCCDGPSRERAEHLVFLVLPEAQPVLTLERAREDYNHDDETGDMEEICRAEVRYVRASASQLTEVLSEMRCGAPGKQTRVKTQRHRWNPNRRQFEPFASAAP